MIDTIRGYLYYMFPCDYNINTREMTMSDHWINKYFQWILIYVIGPLLDISTFITGTEYWFFIKFYGKNQELLKKNI
jgi:hypothetical protein